MQSYKEGAEVWSEGFEITVNFVKEVGTDDD